MMKRLLPIAIVLGALPLLGIGCRNLPLLGNTNSASNENENATTANTNQFAPTNQTEININITTNTSQPVKQPQEIELQRLALSFAERYGSYSNQSNFANLESLYFFMADGLKEETEHYVAAERIKQRDTSVYYGMTTRASSITTQIFDEKAGYAVFLISTLRKEAIGASNNIRTFQQQLQIEFRNTGGSWKVSRATWQKP